MDDTIQQTRLVLERVLAVHMGLDLGQQQDPSAFVICEVGERATTRTYKRGGKVYAIPETTYRVQHMQRLDLGTSYVAVAEHVMRYISGLWNWEYQLRKAGALEPYEPMLPWDLWADATGVGNPVMEMIQERLESSPKTDRCTLHPVTFTHGDHYRRGATLGGTADSLGKAHLVSRLQVLFQQDVLRLPPDDAEAAAMARELKDYEIKVDENANDKYGAFKVGTHDDLVTALGLCCVEDPGYFSAEASAGLW